MASVMQTIFRRRGARPVAASATNGAARTQTVTDVMPVGPDEPDKAEPGMETGACPECGGEMQDGRCTNESCGYVSPGMEDDTPPEEDQSESAPGMNHTRSGAQHMSTNKGAAPPGAAGAAAATLAELNTASFAKDPAFIVECLTRGRTMMQAHEAWAARQEAIAADAQARLAGMARLGGEGTGGTAPVAAMASAAGGAAGGKAGGGLGLTLRPDVAARQFATFEDAVAFYQTPQGGGKTPYQATKHAAINHGELHHDWLARCQSVYLQDASRRRIG